MFLLLVLLRNPVALGKAILIGVLGPSGWGNYTRSMQVSGLTSEAIVNGLVYGTPAGGRYHMIHSVARFELYRAGREYALVGNTGAYSWRKVFGPVTPSNRQLSELAAVVNKMTGMISYAGLAISEGQEALESSLIFPRYLRCSLGLLSDAVQGRVRGNESRRLFSHLATIAVVVYVIVAVI